MARAAILLECCHFVHACNKGTGDVFSRPELSTKKDMATMFHKWALAIGGKLESIIERENEALGERADDSCKLDMPERNFLHEGEEVIKLKCVLVLNTDVKKTFIMWAIGHEAFGHEAFGHEAFGHLPLQFFQLKGPFEI